MLALRTRPGVGRASGRAGLAAAVGCAGRRSAAGAGAGFHRVGVVGSLDRPARMGFGSLGMVVSRNFAKGGYGEELGERARPGYIQVDKENVPLEVGHLSRSSYWILHTAVEEEEEHLPAGRSRRGHCCRKGLT